MERHQFSCDTFSFTNRLMMSNNMEAVCWGGDGVRALGVRDEIVTNVTLLECSRSNAMVRLTIVNSAAIGRIAVSTVGR